MTARARLSALVAVVALLTVTACTSEEDEPSDRASTGEAPSAPNASIEGAPPGLAEAVAARYGTSMTGVATTGTWGSDDIAVVEGTAKNAGDVTLATGRDDSWQVVGGWWPSLGDRGALDLGKPGHVLVLGSDARPGESVTKTRADAIQLLGIDGKGGAGLMGFARDLWVDIPGYGSSKINAALVFKGPEGQVETVSDLTDIPIAGYVLTGFEGFTGAVDALGGLSLDSPRTIKQGKAEIPAGRQTLDGATALAFSRHRKTLPRGDFDRSHHQGLVLIAAGTQLKNADIDKAPAAITLLDQFTESNVSGGDMLRFVATFARAETDQIGHVVATGTFGTAGGGQSIVNLDDAGRAAIADFADGVLDDNWRSTR